MMGSRLDDGLLKESKRKNLHRFACDWYPEIKRRRIICSWKWSWYTFGSCLLARLLARKYHHDREVIPRLSLRLELKIRVAKQSCRKATQSYRNEKPAGKPDSNVDYGCGNVHSRFWMMTINNMINIRELMGNKTAYCLHHSNKQME